MARIKEVINEGVKAGKEFTNKAKDEIIKKFDVNGNGEIDIDDMINNAIKIPGIQINREKFLRKEFELHYESAVVDNAIDTTPISAGIPAEDIDKIADEVIEYERRCVAGIAAVLGVPGGFAMIATLPTDIIQYYGYLLRCAQKLMYLYGFPQIQFEEDGVRLDTATMNELILCLGVMFGVANANKILQAVAKALGEGVAKKLVKIALTKGAIYPIVKSIAGWFGKKITKEIFAGFFKKAIPVAGAALGGGLTYFMFKTCCVRLKNSLKDTKLSNPNHEETKEEKEIYNAIFTVKEELDNTENSQELELK